MKFIPLLVSVILTSCTAAQITPQTTSKTKSDIEAAFIFTTPDGLLESDIAHLKQALHNEAPRIVKSLNVPNPPRVTVYVWKDEGNYQQGMETRTGSSAPGSRGYVTGPDEMHLLYHTRLSAQTEAVHEYVHTVTLHMNPDFGNNPRWLWEAVAQYFANETPDTRTTTHFLDGSCPSIEQLNSPFDKGGAIYDTGYLLGEFIDEKWGLPAMLKLIQTNGDLEGVIGITDELFEDQWCKFAGDRMKSAASE